jgi:hypothetical protein
MAAGADVLVVDALVREALEELAAPAQDEPPARAEPAEVGTVAPEEQAEQREQAANGKEAGSDEA